MAATQPFVHLHVHTDYSLLDGACSIERLFGRAQTLCQPALSITDHGVLFGLADFYKTAKNINGKAAEKGLQAVKPLLGCEVYLTTGSRLDRVEKKSHHMGLLAKNFKGYQNLVKLVTDAHTQGMYYKPRTDFEMLAKHADGLIGFTGCLQGVVPRALLDKGYEEGRKWIGKFVEIFGRENYFVEIQDHHIEEQLKIIPDLLKLADEFGLKVICTNDVHYVEKTDAPTHDVLLCIQTGAKVNDEKRMKYANDNFYLKSYDEMLDIFHERPDSLKNTLLIPEMCDVKLPFGESHYPVFTLPPEIKTRHDARIQEIADGYVELKKRLSGQPFTLKPEVLESMRTKGAVLIDLCAKGLRERYQIDYWHPDTCELPEGRDRAFAKMLVERVNYELGVICGTGFADYFLIIEDYISWCFEKKIAVGPGRGSGAGCLVAYLLRITNVDPIRFGLLFERFLNPERVSPPDFDIDFCMRRRDEVVDYVRQKYGKDCVANIITFGTFGAKMIVRDVARVLDLPVAEGNRLAKLVPDTINITLDEALEKSNELAQDYESNPVTKKIIEHGRIIEGMVRNTGKHACGVIIGDRPLVEFIPLTMQEGALTTQYPKEPVEELGMLKMDFLGLKTLTVLEDAIFNIHTTTNPDFDLGKISFDDKKTFELLQSGRGKAVFQLESGGMQNLCRQLQASSIDEIIALIALYRPGPMEFIPAYIKGKFDPSSVTYAHPLLEKVAKETYGILVYQEQVMEAAKVIAGYTLGGADILRRAMGKKKPEEMAKQRAIFLKGAKETNNIGEKTANEIFDILEKFAGYGFNKSHSAAYAVIAYQTAYLKANYPVQFMAGVFTAELGNAEKLSEFIAEAEAMDIRVAGPDVNRSGLAFTSVFPEDEPQGHIRFGMGGIKGVGEGAAQKIIEERTKNGPYKGFRDFMRRSDPRLVNKRVVENLIKVGAFDGFGHNRGVLLANYEATAAEALADAKDKSTGQGSFLDMMMMGTDTGSASQDDVSERFEGPEMPKAEQLQAEKDLLGFYVSGHPLDDFAGLTKFVNSFVGNDYQKRPHRDPFRLCAVLSTLEKKISKKDNKPWAILHLGTKEQAFEVMLFSEAYEKHAPKLVPGQTYLLTGIISNREGDARLQVDDIQPLKDVMPGQFKELTIVVRNDSGTGDFLKLLKSNLGKNGVPVKLGLQDGPHLLTTSTTDFRWNGDFRKLRDLRRHPSCAGFQAGVIPPPEPPKPKWEKFKKAG